MKFIPKSVFLSDATDMPGQKSGVSRLNHAQNKKIAPAGFRAGFVNKNFGGLSIEGNVELFGVAITDMAIRLKVLRFHHANFTPRCKCDLNHTRFPRFRVRLLQAFTYTGC